MTKRTHIGEAGASKTGREIRSGFDPGNPRQVAKQARIYAAELGLSYAGREKLDTAMLAAVAVREELKRRPGARVTIGFKIEITTPEGQGG